MIFHFTGQVTPETLLQDIEPLVQALLDAGITRLSSVHISALCFTDTAECLIVNDDGLVSQMYFDPVCEEEIAGASRKLRENGSTIIIRPIDMSHGGLGVLFDHND
nr:hypothetical protein [Polymorphobacter sp.]